MTSSYFFGIEGTTEVMPSRKAVIDFAALSGASRSRALSKQMQRQSFSATN
jgi:hypothetical protein